MRKKRHSRALEAAEARAKDIAGIDARLDLGNGLSLAGYEAAISEVRAVLAAYNDLLFKADDQLLDFEALETSLRDLNARVLNGIAATFGPDSEEYAMAGGVRQGDRRHPRRQPEEKV